MVVSRRTRNHPVDLALKARSDVVPAAAPLTDTTPERGQPKGRSQLPARAQSADRPDASSSLYAARPNPTPSECMREDRWRTASNGRLPERAMTGGVQRVPAVGVQRNTFVHHRAPRLWLAKSIEAPIRPARTCSRRRLSHFIRDDVTVALLSVSRNEFLRCSTRPSPPTRRPTPRGTARTGGGSRGPPQGGQVRSTFDVDPAILGPT